METNSDRSQPLLPKDAKNTITQEKKTTQSRTTLLIIAFVVLASRYAIATFLSAFFTPLAAEWQISPTFNGAIFAAYPLGMAITSLMAPQVIVLIGTRTAITGGLILGAIATLAFGLVPDALSPSSPFFSWGFLVAYAFAGLTALWPRRRASSC